MGKGWKVGLEVGCRGAFVRGGGGSTFCSGIQRGHGFSTPGGENGEGGVNSQYFVVAEGLRLYLKVCFVLYLNSGKFRPWERSSGWKCFSDRRGGGSPLILKCPCMLCWSLFPLSPTGTHECRLFFLDRMGWGEVFFWLIRNIDFDAFCSRVDNTFLDARRGKLPPPPHTYHVCLLLFKVFLESLTHGCTFWIRILDHGGTC